MIPFTVNVLERGAAGVPLANVIDNVAPDADSIEWTIADMFGFESCAIPLAGDEADASVWFGRLGCGVAVYGPDAETCWEGRLLEVTYTQGDEKDSRSLDGVKNKLAVAYTNENGGTATGSPVTNSASTSVYGTAEGRLSLNDATSTAATNFATQYLTRAAWPVRRPAQTVGRPYQQRPGRIDLKFEGWYGTLGLVALARTDTTTEQTTAQVGALIGTSSPGIGATNPWLSTSTARIAASGVNDTRKTSDNTTYRQKIEALLAQGNSSGQRLAWGVYEGRTFVVEVWAGTTPYSTDYRRGTYTQGLLNPSGADVALWNVRPNKMFERMGVVDTVVRSTEADTGSRFAVARVRFRCEASGLMTVQLEPSEVNDFTARQARLTRGVR